VRVAATRSVLTPTVAVSAFLIAGLIAVAVIGSAVVIVLRSQADREAIGQAKVLTQVEARDIAAPYLVDAALHPGPQQRALDAVVHGHVLGADVVRVKVWAADGTILYSDDAALVGQRFPLSPADRHALAGPPAAEISNLSAPENVAERHFGKLLEVYLGVRTPSGRPLLFETYRRYQSISNSSNRLLLRSLPALIGGLLLLYLIQAPLAYMLARRLRQAQEEREQAFVEAFATADRERRRVASDLHDGVVQGVAGISYKLTATAHEAEAHGDPTVASALREFGVQLRHWVRELRTYVLVIAPPRLHERGIQAALEDLASTLRARGIDVEVDVDAGLPLDTDTEELMYRVAQEAARNIVKHANATHVDFAVAYSRASLVLTVRDNGVGLPEQRSSATDIGEGGAGLRLLAEVAEQSGAVMRVRDVDGGGVLVELVVAAAVPVST
jgi:two-component system NarL family sensor kinase